MKRDMEGDGLKIWIIEIELPSQPEPLLTEACLRTPVLIFHSLFSTWNRPKRRSYERKGVKPNGEKAVEKSGQASKRLGSISSLG